MFYKQRADSNESALCFFSFPHNGIPKGQVPRAGPRGTVPSGSRAKPLHSRMLTEHRAALTGHIAKHFPNAVGAAGERKRAAGIIGEIFTVGRLCQDGEHRRFSHMRKDLSALFICRKHRGEAYCFHIRGSNAEKHRKHRAADAGVGEIFRAHEGKELLHAPCRHPERSR